MSDGPAEFGTELILTSENELNEFLEGVTWGDPKLVALDDIASERQQLHKLANADIKDPQIKPLTPEERALIAGRLGALQDRIRAQELNVPGYGDARKKAEKIFQLVVDDHTATGRFDKYLRGPVAAAELIRQKINPIVNKTLQPQP